MDNERKWPGVPPDWTDSDWADRLRGREPGRERELEQRIAAQQHQLQAQQAQLQHAIADRDASRVQAFQIRDQIAVECLKAFLGRFGEGAEAATKFSADGLAKSAYEMADAMMKERARTMPQPEPVAPIAGAMAQTITNQQLITHGKARERR